jgi:DUF1680 family protein
MEGHAVRDCLLCAGLVAAGETDNRTDYLTTAQRLWDNMVHCKMYVTGGLGSMPKFEGFGADYELPNDSAYCEVCAAVAGGFFDENMNLAFADARYADALEKELFNGALVGVSLKGTSYFYDNPLAVNDKHERWTWNGCPCCPPMFLKLMSALPGYIYAQEPNAVYVNQFIGSHATLTLNNTQVSLRQSSRYPWDGRIKLSVRPAQSTDFTLYVRLPAWCDDPQMSLNGRPLKDLKVVHGYACLQRTWNRGDVVELSLPMPVQRVKADLRVQADNGRVALQRGPVVYCLEGVDNGGHVRNLIIPPTAPFKVKWQPDLLGGVNIIKGSALIGVSSESMSFTAIPYFAQDNRQAGEMEVWADAR